MMQFEKKELHDGHYVAHAFSNYFAKNLDDKDQTLIMIFVLGLLGIY